MCRRRWLTLRDRYGREVRKTNAPSGSGMEFQRQWHLLEAMKFLKPNVVPRPVRFSQNICETAITDQGQLQSPGEETQLQPQGHAQEVEMPSPLWPLSPISPITILLPSPSPPFSVAQNVPSPTPSTSTSLPSPSCSTQVATKKGRKRGSSVSTTSEVDQKMIESIELFKNKWSSTQPTQQTKQQQSANPAMKSFNTLIVSILNKMDEEKQARAIEKMLQAAVEVRKGA